MGLRRPKRITILGMDLTGEIEAIGKDVKMFNEGDQVFAATGFRDMGACTGTICLPEESEEGALAIKPSNMMYPGSRSCSCWGDGSIEFY